MKKSLPKIIVVVGPTASGKTALAIELAKKYNGEVISADSRQVYKSLDIGTGKVTQKEMAGISHYMLDVASPKRTFTAEQFKQKAEKAIQTILQKGKLPIICGGTGFYIDALVNNVQFPNVPPNKNLRKKLSTKSAAELFALLEGAEPTRAETIDRHNPYRLIRALEIVEALGKVPPQQQKSPYNALWIGLAPQPELLKQKIHNRLIERIDQGMLTEALRLHAQGLSFKRMEALGLEYRYQAYYLQKKITKDEMLTQLEQAINHYVKRQMTWFKRNKNIHWFEPTKTQHISKIIKEFLK